ncbi:MAG: hypothetical protein ACD_23C00275G0001, partial [uncultured bacterium]
MKLRQIFLLLLAANTMLAGATEIPDLGADDTSLHATR